LICSNSWRQCGLNSFAWRFFAPACCYRAACWTCFIPQCCRCECDAALRLQNSETRSLAVVDARSCHAPADCRVCADFGFKGSSGSPWVRMMVLDVVHCLRQRCGAIRAGRCSKRARFLHPARLRTLYAQLRPRKVLVMSMDGRCRVASWLMPCAHVTACIRALGCSGACLLWPLRQRNSRCPARRSTPGTHVTYWNDKLGRCDAISSVLRVAVPVLIPSSPASPFAHPAGSPSTSEGVTNDHGCALPAHLLANTQALSSQHWCARLADCPLAHAGHSDSATHAASLTEAPQEHI
jgi:hypothetical protein